MFKMLFLFCLVLSSTVAFASPLEQMMTMKDRLRISLWVEGIEDKPQEKALLKSKRDLPEEIERALRKL